MSAMLLNFYLSQVLDFHQALKPTLPIKPSTVSLLNNRMVQLSSLNTVFLAIPIHTTTSRQNLSRSSLSSRLLMILSILQPSHMWGRCCQSRSGTVDIDRRKLFRLRSPHELDDGQVSQEITLLSQYDTDTSHDN